MRATVVKPVSFLVWMFDEFFRFLTDNFVVVLFESWAAWVGRYPLLFGQIILYLLIAWGVFGGELGLTDLYWIDSWKGQLASGFASCWLFGVVIFINYLLLTPKNLPGLASEDWRGYWTLFPSKNPGLRQVGLWMLWWLIGLLFLLYIGKAGALFVDAPRGTTGWHNIMSFMADRYGTIFYLLGYILGLQFVFLISWLDSWAELRETIAKSNLLSRPFKDRAIPIPAGQRDQALTGGTVVKAGSPKPDEERYVTIQSYDVVKRTRDATAETPSSTMASEADHTTAIDETALTPSIEEQATLPPQEATDAEYEAAQNNLLTIKLMHAMGLLVGILSLGLILMVSTAAIWIVASPLVVLSLLLIFLDVFGGFFAFRGRATRTVAVMAVLILLLLNWERLVGNKMSFPNIIADDDPCRYDRVLCGEGTYQAMTARPEGGLIDGDRWLTTFHDTRKDLTTAKKPRLILIATSGGGIRSAVWTAVVMEHLERMDKLKQYKFRKQIGMFAGASGGMVGAAAYVANFHNGKLDQTVDPITGLRPLSKTLAEESLCAVVQTMLLRDFTLNMILPFPTETDRGRTLEWAWDQNFLNSNQPNWQKSSPLAGKIRDLKSDEEKWERPSLVFSPMFVEDSKRLLISNHDLHALTEPTSYRLPDGKAAPHSLPAIEFFKVFPGAKDFKIGTASRMSATFPVVSPAVGLPVLPPRRVVDAGYYDNYGVDVLCQWLLSHRQAVIAHTSGVLIIQIRAYPLDDDGLHINKVSPSPVQLLAGSVSAPLEALMTARGSAANHRNSAILMATGKAFARDDAGQALGADFLATTALEMDGAAALSWILTNEQKRLVAQGCQARLKNNFDAIETWYGDGKK